MLYLSHKRQDPAAPPDPQPSQSMTEAAATAQAPVQPTALPVANKPQANSQNSNSTGRDHQNPLSVVGAGAPHRPEIVLDDEKKKKYAALWNEKIRTISTAQMEELLKAEDGWHYGDHIEAGLSPWIVELKSATDSGPNRCIAGGVVKATLESVWEQPQNGSYSLTNTKVVPPWEIVGKPTGFNGQFNTNKGWIVINRVAMLVRVPSTSPPGDVTLHMSGDAKGPSDAAASIKAQDYRLVIGSAPRPDRETLLSFWGYVVQSVGKDGKSLNVGFGNQREFAMPAVSYLNLFANQLDGDMQVLARELLDHSAFKKAVSLLKEAEKAEKLEAEKPRKSE